MDQFPPESQPTEPQEPNIVPEPRTREYIKKYFVRIPYAIMFIGIAIAAVVYGGMWLWQKQNVQVPKEAISQEYLIRENVEMVLNQSGIENAKLISVSVNDNNITLNFSKEILSKGQGVFEDTFQKISNSIHPIIQGSGINPRYEEIKYTVLIDGIKLNDWQTRDWKIYRNDEHGVEFKYPQEWYLSQGNYIYPTLLRVDLDTRTSWYSPVFFFDIFVPSETWETYVLRTWGIEDAGEKEIINGVSFLKINQDTRVIYVKKIGDDRALSIYMSPQDEVGWEQLNQILSTFKFTKLLPTSPISNSVE